jgi:hypothetical protein
MWKTVDIPTDCSLEQLCLNSIHFRKVAVEHYPFTLRRGSDHAMGPQLQKMSFKNAA